MAEIRNFQLLIGGTLEDGTKNGVVINPATEAAITAYPCADTKQLERAVASANDAFSAWAATPIDERARLLHAMADAMDANLDDLARLLTLEQGKPLPLAKIEISRSALRFRQFAEYRLAEEVREDGEGRRTRLRRRPIGVIAAIVPWNFPIALMANKVPMALLAGNTVILKPAPTTPLATLHFGRLMANILPPGVLNVLADDGALGAEMTAHPLIRKVTFTGSTATGKRVMAGAADTLKRVTLELGGNDAAIVLKDADPNTTAKGLFAGAFGNSGQICAAVKRVYAHDDVYDALCDELVALADAAVVGDGLAHDTQFGPVQNRTQYERVLALIADARSHGHVVTGAGDTPPRGYFIRPTIVRDVADHAAIVREEQFGPVLPVLRYRDIDDAIARANDSPYGLGGSVWSSDEARAAAIAERFDSGSVWINRHPDIAGHIPFSGAKESGIGVELGEEGFAEFTQLQVISSYQPAT